MKNYPLFTLSAGVTGGLRLKNVGVSDGFIPSAVAAFAKFSGAAVASI
jgi:hypothetical protein